MITDPKLRVISTAAIEQRIMHHAIIRAVLKLHFQNSFRLKTRFHKALA
ncbi:MAG: hypothetical protein LBD37_10755 [Treponema sp.]|nr:hypothetical protein [Treponema sp.]